MSVKLSNALKAQLLDSGIDSEAFAREFATWKAGWPKGEYNHALFGKDAAYVRPKVGTELYRLRHVHIVPFIDKRARKRWFRAFEFRRRKTSDRHLVYVADDRSNFGLIYILDEPDAHRIALMAGEKERQVMEGFAVMAENFIFDGTLD
ncbi:type II toxin-antitoxin system YafO family toxin [Pseudoxanthomonas sp.]|uniref:type II toxin-antitoxin system YafO family toxin n=1 Tax=Pseudoxanthomonas sp. TaxID=1871049 RepID=UPI003F80DACC